MLRCEDDLGQKRDVRKSRVLDDYFFLVLIFFSTIAPLQRVAAATRYALEPGQKITENQTLVSPAGNFALGFFQLGNTSSAGIKRYLGIWYNNIPDITVVWVANREQPLAHSGAFLTLAADGNMALMNSSGSSIWSSNVSGLTNGTEAMLLDSGNLVLRRESGEKVWMSFDHPTDTFLPEMRFEYNEKTGIGHRIVAWKSSVDPSPGDFSGGLSSLQIFIWRRNEIYWSNGAAIGNFGVWPLQNNKTGIVPFFYQISRSGSNFSIGSSTIGGTAPVRWTLHPAGELKLMMWNQELGKWERFQWAPFCVCDLYRGCGTWGACDVIAQPPTCKCLTGFVPKNQSQWEKMNFSGGCVRTAPLLFSSHDSFLPVENTKLPNGFALIQSKSEANCKSECLSRNRCTAYAYSNATVEPDDFVCLVWHGDIADLRAADSGPANLYIRMVEKDTLGKPGSFLRFILLSIGALLLGVGTLFIVLRVKLKGEKRARERMMSEDIHIPDAFRRVNEFSDAPFLDFKTVKRSTSNFSAANKLGEGGFGSVFKGKLACGQEVAVKRLSRGSKQGQREFANEVKLIAKLQHENLVRLLGWCIHKEEKILIYEYLPNKSLDRLIFGKSAELSWEKRLAIIQGIADGLLYLHHHSRMRVIHRDLKTSNVLLDSEMNPKISDFGLAKIMEINETEGSTKKVVGTLGYMSPEYALEGVYSEKSDVFGFGVIMLEIISGKRSTRYYPCTDSRNLLGHAWKLWNDGMAVELFDPQVAGSFHVDKALRFIQVALLCIEENAAQRPTMASVVSMLGSESLTLPAPRQPGFSFGREVNLHADGSPRVSISGLTETTFEAR